MDELMKAAWLSWQETRDETTTFIRSLSERQLTQILPRPGLNTFGKHFHELGVIQNAFTLALREGRLVYSNMAFESDPDLEASADKLISFLDAKNADFQREVEAIREPLQVIDWQLPRNPTALEHVFWLMQHETLHHGQLLAFCYVTNTPFPEALSQHWNMPPLAPGIVSEWFRANADK
jgi:uncharacterized damage-inducible protein DinB